MALFMIKDLERDYGHAMDTYVMHVHCRLEKPKLLRRRNKSASREFHSIVVRQI